MPSGKLRPISSLVGSIDTAGGTKDHNRLLNRDLPDQHPIEAITGLLEAFNQIDSKIATLNQKIDSEAEFVASEIELINNELNSLTEQVAGLDNKFTNAIELLNERIEEIRQEVQRIISELSIEELSKRDYYDPDDDPDTRYELATEFDSEQQYYERAYDVDDTRLEGMWQLPEELNYIQDLANFPWTNFAQGYYYSTSGLKVTFAMFGCQANKDGQSEKNFYGVAVGDGHGGAYGILYKAYYSYGTDYFDYNPLPGPKGYSDDGMRLLYFESSESSESCANKWKFVGATKVSDTLLERGNTNYLIKYNPVTITEEEFEPNKYYIKKTTVTKYELATDPNFDPDARYYEEVYDVDNTNLLGMWQLPEELNYIVSIHNFPWINDVDGYYYNGNGTKITFQRFGCLTPGIVTGDTHIEDTSKLLGVGVGQTWQGYYFPLKSYYSYGTDYVDYNILDNSKGYKNNYGSPNDAMRLLYFKAADDPKEFAESWKFVGAIKVSDTLLDYGDTNYKTKFVPVILTEETYEPNKYYIRKDLPIPKVTRIELGEDSSTYRDSLGNDVLKIVKNNVLLNGDKLAPELSISSDTNVQLVLENNAEVVYSDIASAEFTIPNNIKHGYCSSITFTTINVRPSSVRFINNSTYEIRYIYQNKATAFSDITFSGNCEYNIIIICNGRYVEVYIQEIEL